MPSPASNPLNRRQFLRSSANNAAGVAAGMVGLAGVAGMATPNDRISVGVIGVRSQGKLLATTLAGMPEVCVTAVCDIDDHVASAAAHAVEEIQGRQPRQERDFRRLLEDPTIDAVVIATPNHWHALMTTWACEAGKDVYLESPVMHSLHEGPVMREIADRTRRVVSVGLPQRSGSQFASAIDYVKSGKLGSVHLAKAWTVHLRKPIGHKADTRPPEGVDYDLWLGPATARAFNPNRFHFNWQWFWDYGSGELGHWGVQMLDIARWGLGVNLPRQVSAIGGKHYFHDDQETPDTLQVNYAFTGKTIAWEHRLWSPHGQEGRNAAVAFYGDLGTLIVDRGGWKVYGQKDAAVGNSSEFLVPHLQNFIRSIRTREAPACDLETGRLSSALSTLGTIAYRLGRSVDFDPALEIFPNDRAAQMMIQLEYRAPWALPEV